MNVLAVALTVEQKHHFCGECYDDNPKALGVNEFEHGLLPSNPGKVFQNLDIILNMKSQLT